jgi:flagellar L-ring protein precursor FlgH
MKPLVVFLISCTAFAQSDPSPGSLFTSWGLLADTARDLRARNVGDLVTIIVSDRASAVARGVTNTARKSSAANSIASLGGALPAANPLSGLVDLSNAQQLQGEGQTSRNMTLFTTISAQVVDVLPNGVLLIEGSKDVSINSERQIVSLTGMIRPYDLTTANTIRSDQVADLAIRVNGKGVVGDAIRRPFVLYRVLLGLLPF